MLFGRTLLAKKGRGPIPHNARRVPSVAGFMMIELLISVLIMSAMSTLVLSANSNMSARLQTDNLAHQIALSIREAQTRALSATAPIGASGAANIPGYGVYINMGDNTKTQLFSDTRTGNYVAYYAGVSQSDTPGQSLGQGYTIDQISALPSGGGSTVQNTGAVSIFFHRPRPDAQIFYSGSPTDSSPSAGLRASQATIRIHSPKGYSKTVTVTSTGQISVQ